MTKARKGDSFLAEQVVKPGRAVVPSRGSIDTATEEIGW